MTGLDQLGEVAEKQGEQQHLDMRAVHVGVTQDADLAVAQATHVRRVVRAVGIDADGDRNVVDLGVGEQPVAVDLPGVQNLAAQGQDGLVFFVAAHFGAAPGRVALDQKDLVVGQIAALAIGEFAGQHRHARALALLHLLPGALANLRGFDRQLGQFFTVFDVLVEPELQHRAHAG